MVLVVMATVLAKPLLKLKQVMQKKGYQSSQLGLPPFFKSLLLSKCMLYGALVLQVQIWNQLCTVGSILSLNNNSAMENVPISFSSQGITSEMLPSYSQVWEGGGKMFPFSSQFWINIHG